MLKKWIIVMMLLIPVSALGAEHRLGITPTEAYQIVKEQGGSILFIDVRDPMEIMFTGFTDNVDRNIPLAITDPFDFDDKQAAFRMNFNKNFIAEVDKALAKKGLNRDSLIITMCRSGGARGLPSAELLLKNGFSKVKFVEHGFLRQKCTDFSDTELLKFIFLENTNNDFFWQRVMFAGRDRSKA